MASLRDFDLGKKDARPSTAPPRLVETIAPPATPPPEDALRPSTAVVMRPARPISISDTEAGIHAWLRLYARTVNFSNLPLTPQGAMMAQHIKPMPPKDCKGFVSQPPTMTALEAFVAAVVIKIITSRSSQASQASALPKVDLAALKAEGRKEEIQLTFLRTAESKNDPDFFFEDQKPKLPVEQLPSQFGQLELPFPKEMVERWQGGTMDKDVFEFVRNEQARRNGENYERPDTPMSELVVDEVDFEADTYEVQRLTGFNLYTALLKNPQMPLAWDDIHFAAAGFGTLRSEKQSADDFSEDMKINLTEMSLIAPNGPRSQHWELGCQQLGQGERKNLEAAYVERLKPVYEQLGGDLEKPEAPCVDFRLFVVVLIGLAKFGDKPKLTGSTTGESKEQKQARKRLTMAIRVLCPNEIRDLTEDELFIVILAMHLIFIENSHKLHELVRKKVDILSTLDFSERSGLNTTQFPTVATSGSAAAHLVFPTVHEIAALNLNIFPDCFRTLKGQQLLNQLPRKAKYVGCPPGSVEFLAQEMPDEIPIEDQRGDGSPCLNAKEKNFFKGSDFFDPDVLQDNWDKIYARAWAARKIREAKRAEAEIGEVQLPPGLPVPENERNAPTTMERDGEGAGEAKREEAEIGEVGLPPGLPERNAPTTMERDGEGAGGEGGVPPERHNLHAPPAPVNVDGVAGGEWGVQPVPPEPDHLHAPPAPVNVDGVAGGEWGVPPEPDHLHAPPAPDWNILELLDKSQKDPPREFALMDLSGENHEGFAVSPPVPQPAAAQPKTGNPGPTVPPLSLRAQPPKLMQNAHVHDGEQDNARAIQVAPDDFNAVRNWTWEEFQRAKWRAKFSTCCSCESMKDTQFKMILLALIFVGLAILVFGMRSSFSQKLASEAMNALAGVFFFLGCITCCKSCCRTADAEAIEAQINHPDAAIGRPLIYDSEPLVGGALDMV